MRTARYSRRSRAFSLIEALFAVAILFAAIGAFLDLVPFSLQANQHDSFYLQAVAAGQQYLDALRDATENGGPQPPPPQIKIDAGTSLVDPQTKNTSPGNFVISGSCNAVSGAPALLRYCSVTVQWTEYGQSRTYVVESYATKQVS